MFPWQKLPALSPKRETGFFWRTYKTLFSGCGWLQEMEVRVWGYKLKMWGRSSGTLAQSWPYREAREQAEAADMMGETEEKGCTVSMAANEGTWQPRDEREAGTAWKRRRLEVLFLLKPLEGCFLHPWAPQGAQATRAEHRALVTLLQKSYSRNRQYYHPLDHSPCVLLVPLHGVSQREVMCFIKDGWRFVHWCASQRLKSFY